MKKSNKKLILGLIIVAAGFVLLLTAAFIIPDGAAISSFDPQNKNAAARALNGIIQQHARDKAFSGSVLIATGDQILLNEGYGYASKYIGRTKNMPDTKFLLGSMTKTFTALAVLQLEEAGFIRLDDRITQYFPEYTGWNNVTITNLLNHTSGIQNYYETIPDQIHYFLGHTTPAAIMERFKDTPLKFAPGAEFDYSNTNYMILTAIIEQVSGQSYIDYLNQHILTPMGLSGTGYAEYPLSVEGMAHSYCLNGVVEVTGFNLSNFYGAGGLYSTTGDLYRFQQGLDYQKLITEQSSVRINLKYDYGYGMMFTDDAQFGPVYEISGGGPGINTIMYFLPDADLHVIILSNSQEADTEALAKELFRAVMDQQP